MCTGRLKFAMTGESIKRCGAVDAVGNNVCGCALKLELSPAPAIGRKSKMTVLDWIDNSTSELLYDG